MFRKAAKILIAGLALLLIVVLLMPIPDLGGGLVNGNKSHFGRRSEFGKEYSDIVLDRQGRMLRVFLNDADQWIFPPGDEEIPEKLRICVLTFEDRRFMYHPGVDPIAVARAVVQNVRGRRYVSGASTITMQAVRIAGGRERTLWNKAIESLTAIKLDLLRSKKKILKLYLEHAPYGSNIRGYRAASWRYWGRPPEELTWAEAATLAVLPNNPSRINPDRDTTPLKLKRDRLIERLHEKGIIDTETMELSKLEAIPEGQMPFPLHAPHFARLVASEHDGITRTTVDLVIQKRVERILSEYQDNISHFGVDNSCALIVETRTGRIAAYAGSADFYGNNSGRVDGIRAKRSYGSVLKPYLYGLCFEKGIVHPNTMIRDIPTYYGAFAPANASGDNRGLVSAETALQLSLNVPAVRLLYEYGYQDFHNRLLDMGIESLSHDPDHYGLTIILGGGEATMWEIARLYRCLGNLGEYGDIGYIEDDYPSEGSVLERGAAWQVLEILKGLSRPGAEQSWEMYESRWPIAWKTGTSYGYRDAWACGGTPEWTICVWVGNFDGRGNPAIVGNDLAGPLLFRLFNALPKEDVWWDEPESRLVRTQICPATGLHIGKNCPDTVWAKVPLGAELKRCEAHKKVFLSADRKNMVCSLCWQDGEPVDSVWLFHPPGVVEYLRKRGVAYQQPPEHRQSCSASGISPTFEIVYPVDGGAVILPGRGSGLIARASHAARESELFWYLDNTFVGSTTTGSGISEHSIEIKMNTGRHSMSVVDTDGFRKTIHFRVSG